jgi:outer membrane receptor protein involved in Fe transport
MTLSTQVLFPARIAGTAAALLLLTSLAQAQVAATPDKPADIADKNKIPVEKKVGNSSPDSEVVMMSVFEVNANDDKGYLASSSLSGTRLNTKLEDLASSITVVTKEQLTDLAARDINDVFMYEANTEGIYQYSDFTNDRGNITDNIANSPQTANRVRGLGAANIALGSYTTLGTIPIDTYNVESVEISRGPNSSIFGLGNTGGSVNVNTSFANTSRDISSVTAGVTNSTGRRASFDFNRVVLKDRLAVRVSALYNEAAFERRPAEDFTRRVQASITVRPFKSTSIKWTFESYRNRNSRPNSYTPRNMYADWVGSGKPTWDPMTETAHLANGTSIVVTEKNEKTLLPYGLSVYDSGLGSRPSWYIDNGEVKLYMVNRTSTTALPNNVGGTGRLLLNGTALARDSATNTTMPLYTVPGTTDKGYYDWSSINLSAPNLQYINGETNRLELEHYFFQTPVHTLAFQAGWFRENVFTNSRSFIGYSDGAKMQVYIDVNEKLLDGTTNPFFLRPFIGGSEPAYKKIPAFNDNYRATLAYDLDLTKEGGFIKWLGHHRFAGYSEYRYVKTTSGFIYRDRIISTESWVSASSKGGSTGGSANIFPHYYVGDAVGQNVDYAPQRLIRSNGTYMFRYYDGVNKQWINEPVEFGESYGGGQFTKRLNTTYGGTWQGYFLQDRIVPLFGYREDRNRSRRGDSAGNPSLATDGYYDTSTLDNFTTQPWVSRIGRTKTKGIVLKPLSWFHVHYNESDSFKPESLAYDIWGKPLADPQGESKDYGFTLNLFKNTLSIRATQYETYDTNTRSTLGTIVQRAIRLDADGTMSDPDLQDWLTTELTSVHPDWSEAQLSAETAKLMGLDPALIDSHRNLAHSDVNDAISKGKEIEISYNPNRYWTIKANVTQQKAMDTNLSPSLQAYIDSRWSTWTTIKSPATGALWWKSTIGSTTPESWYYSNVNKDLKLATTTAGKYKAQTREWRANLVNRYKIAGLTENRWLSPLEVTTAVRWEGKVGIGYLAGAPDTDGIVRTLDGSKPVYDKARTYYDLGLRYGFKMSSDRIRTTLQLNVTNIFEDGGLRVVGINPDGSPYQYRIIDPRRISFSVTFDL